MEFTPVIMAAGEGSRMTDLTSKCPKALLPVGNMPMIWYPVNMLERAGFEEAIVIVLQSTLNEIQKTLVDIHGVKMKLLFEPIPDNDLGTADSLRNLKGKIKTDVLVISCDLITDLSLHHIANVHRTYNASVTMLLSTVPQQYLDIAPPGVKSRKRSEKDFIGFDEKGDRVLFMASEADLEDTVTFRKSVLKRHPFINIKSGLTDCHLYLMKKWVIDYLSTSQSLSSIKSELIPYLVKKQFSKPKQEMPNTNQSVISEDTKPDIFSFSSEDPLAQEVQEMSTWIDHQGDMEDCYHDNKIRCYAYVQDGGFCVRANTLSAYSESNKQIPKILQNIAPKLEITNIHPAATVKNKSQVGTECLVAEGTTLGEKSSVKRAIVGKHCKIGDKCKIANSVIMDYVNILDGCSVTGSIVGSNVHIHEKCEIKDCIVGAGQSLNAMGQFTNEAIVDIDKMMEI
ncbi:translation initiation factor eIF-2B subunit gamma-like [Mytilus californianus]|uniref:translation initiation factor eIF-2B subunit gamma-like n=1 Tax=Mytilus californianus TaxID=6549 RepID=UPI002245E2CF|nr:translation initiation factor eIF-2B subunit gamma-like [Mytilus californianus]XP_052066037.1 translation initiation factor eIF-2B subunit gamma-like [Mytilus californianus]